MLDFSDAFLLPGAGAADMRYRLLELQLETRPDWRQWAEQRLALMGSETITPNQP